MRRRPGSSNAPPTTGGGSSWWGSWNVAHRSRTSGRTALHTAAGAGELGVVRVLVDRGADPTVADPEYHATPLGWAEFLQQPEVAAFLRAPARLTHYCAAKKSRIRFVASMVRVVLPNWGRSMMPSGHVCPPPSTV